MNQAPPKSLWDLVDCGACSVMEVFDARMQASPDRPFLIWHGKVWRYAEARNSCIALAGFLQQRFDLRMLRVASYLGNRPEAMWTWLGTLYAGGVLISINRLQKGILLEDMILRARAEVLVTEKSALTQLPEPQFLRATGIQLVIIVDDDTSAAPDSIIETIPFARASCAPAWQKVDRRPGDLAAVMYTSGTTGRSKAVMIVHNQYCRNAARLVDAYGLRSTDVFHNWLPLYHIAGQLHMTLTAVIAGGTVALFPKFSTSRFAEEVAETGATVLCGFAAILHFISSLPPAAANTMSSLRVGIMAGIPTDMHRQFESRFGMWLGENYGMTELDPITQPTPGIQTPLGSCGLASPDIEIMIGNADGSPVGHGTVGNIFVRPKAADIMAMGYEGDQEATERAWQHGWFDTGDYGMQDADGFLFFKGRANSYIRRRGENISVDELCTLFSGHAAIAECAAVAVPSEVGEDDIKMVVVLREHSKTTPEELHFHASQSLASFMVPRYIEIRDELPRSDIGKVKQHELRNLGPDVWDSAVLREKPVAKGQ